MQTYTDILFSGYLLGAQRDGLYLFALREGREQARMASGKRISHNSSLQ